MQQMFAEDLERCEEIKLSKWFHRPRWSRIKESIADLLKPQL